MTKILDDGDRIKLSLLDVQALTALLPGVMTGYAIARRIESDSDRKLHISNGALYPALKRLELCGLIKGVEDIPKFGNKPQRRYAITAWGKQVLEWEIESLATLVGIARYRTTESR